MTGSGAGALRQGARRVAELPGATASAEPGSHAPSAQPRKIAGNCRRHLRKVSYTQNTDTWTISGNATLGTQRAGLRRAKSAFTGVSVSNTTITLVNGEFSEVTFDFSFDFTLFGARHSNTGEFGACYCRTTSAENQFEMSGGFEVAFDGNTVAVTLGDGPGNDAPGPGDPERHRHNGERRCRHRHQPVRRKLPDHRARG